MANRRMTIAFGIAALSAASIVIAAPATSRNLVAFKRIAPPSAVENPISWALRQTYPSLLRDISPKKLVSDPTLGSFTMVAQRGIGGSESASTIVVSGGALNDWLGNTTAGWIVAGILVLPLPFLFRMRRRHDPLADAARRQAILKAQIEKAHR